MNQAFCKKYLCFFKIVPILAICLSPAMALAQETGYQGINLNAPFAGISKVNNLGEYIAAIYNYGLGIAGVLAGIMVTIGGVKWLMAAGNKSSIDSAKKTIFGGIMGMILLFSSYIILNTVNPQLVNLKIPNIRNIARSDLEIPLGAANCTPGTLACTCRGNDPETPNTCNAGLKCVATRFVFVTDDVALSQEIWTNAGAAAVGAAVVTRNPYATIIGFTAGSVITAVSGVGQTLYKCTDGRDGTPCDNDSDCENGHCQEYYHLCYRTPVEIGGMCNPSITGEECKAPGICTPFPAGIAGTFEGIPSFCRGQAGRGERCRSNDDCIREPSGALTCLKPINPLGFGRCVPQREGQTQENDPCVLTTDGGITPPACGEGNEFSCFYCPASGEPGTSEGRYWTRLRQEAPNATRRVGQCKSNQNVRFQRCAN